MFNGCTSLPLDGAGPQPSCVPAVYLPTGRGACVCVCGVRMRVCACSMLFVTLRCPQIAEANEGNANEMFLFHGSPFVKNIVESGFDERHSCATGMFGAGWCIECVFVRRCV